MSLDPQKTNRMLAQSSQHQFSLVSTTKTAELKRLPTKRKNYIFIKVGSDFEKVIFDDVLFVKAEGSYSTIQTRYKTYMSSINLKSVLSQFKWPSLRRCHRSYAINLDTIESYNDRIAIVGAGDQSHTVPISRSYKQEISESLPKLCTD